ncbi:hypothetical protein ABT247_18165 [Kitasatospora sp. NPDC001539]|uniref:hypothetical protein n=1 Tax=Kitasatospora sp. NPDC001539 TaxID=3154384 RepID=UPI0033239667
MATSEGVGRLVLRYLESTRNLVGCAGGAVGLGLHFAGLGGAWWPGVVAGLYGVGALLTPAPVRPSAPESPPEPASTPQAAEPEPASPPRAPEPASPPRAPEPEPVVPRPELEALADYLGTVPLPASAGVDALLAALRGAGPGPVADRIVGYRLPVAVDGYLRARTWLPWAGPDAPDPAAQLGREVRRLAAELG